jgi:hypothetical protein
MESLSPGSKIQNSDLYRLLELIILPHNEAAKREASPIGRILSVL